LLTFLWLLTGAALIVAAAALMKARRLARRLERLTESYWELRYEHGQLRARLNRLDPEPSSPAGSEPARQPGVTAFVPLSSLKAPQRAQTARLGPRSDD
jgi:hypothetical protein